MDHPNRGSLWLRWVGANALAELIGLGATLALDALIIWQVSELGWIGSVAGILLVTLTGAIEGTAVGLLQWAALRQAFPAIPRRAWWAATVIGAMVAWFFGSLPSALIDMGAQAGSAPVEEPPQALVLLMAAGMGLVLGPILSLAQWVALRKAARRAWMWMPANALAWGLGMPIIFGVIDLAQQTGSTLVIVLMVAAGLLVTGAVVGAAHGLALVWLASPPSPRAAPSPA